MTVMAPTYPRLAARRTTWQAFVLPVLLILLAFKTSEAGYYNSEAYRDFYIHGYRSMSRVASLDNPSSFVGTVYSILAISFLPFALPFKFRPQTLCVLFIYAYIVITSLWSNVLLGTFYYMAASAITVVTLDTILNRLSLKSIYKTMLVCTALLICASAYLSLRYPEFRTSVGISGGVAGGGWRGAFAHKNAFAEFCFFMLAFFLPFATRPDTRMSATTVVTALAICIFMSNGKTGMYLTIFYIFYVVALIFIKKINVIPSNIYYKYISMIVVYASISLVPLLVLLDVASFTGRAILWKFFLSNLGISLLFGAGGLSLRLDPGIAYKSISMIGVPLPDSSMVVIIYEQGIIGAFIYFFLLNYLMFNCINSNSKFAPFAATSIACFAIYGCLESNATFNMSIGLIIILTMVGLTQSETVPRNRSTAPGVRKHAMVFGRARQPSGGASALISDATNSPPQAAPKGA